MLHGSFRAVSSGIKYMGTLFRRTAVHRLLPCARSLSGNMFWRSGAPKDATFWGSRGAQPPGYFGCAYGNLSPRSFKFGLAYHLFASNQRTTSSLTSNYAIVEGDSGESSVEGDAARRYSAKRYHSGSMLKAAKVEGSNEQSEYPTRLLSGVMSIPHPDKKAKGGEDSHFISSCGLTVGVADGVGGWAELGIDAGEYSRQLMSNTQEEAERTAKGERDPVEMLKVAHQRTDVLGSCTACILSLQDGGVLRAANLGDSGFVLVREGRVLFRSPSQQHDFNFPFQLGRTGSDLPTDAQSFAVPVRPGDILVLGTDGLFDNVFDRDVLAVTRSSLETVKETSAKQGGKKNPASSLALATRMAAELAELAAEYANDPVRLSPFSKAAAEAGYTYRGGKADDITVLVSFVQ